MRYQGICKSLHNFGSDLQNYDFYKLERLVKDCEVDDIYLTDEDIDFQESDLYDPYIEYGRRGK